VLEFSSDKRNPQKLQMANLQQRVKTLVNGLLPALEKLLPEGIVLPDSQVQKIGNSICREDIFFLDSKSSLEIMGPLCHQFKQGHMNMTSSELLIHAWLEKEQKFLGHLLATLFVAGGVSPRTHFAQACCIRGTQRNLFYILDSLVWRNSQHKKNSATQSRGGLWAFPLQVAWPLFYYLGVVRPFSTSLLTQLHIQNDSDILKNYLFVHSSEFRVWTRKETKQVLEEFFAKPLDIKLSCFDLRQILQAVANKHLGYHTGKFTHISSN
jgi:hypothetical protein